MSDQAEVPAPDWFPVSPGKLDPESLERLVLNHLGAARPEVVVGPRAGVDAAVIKIGAGRVMTVTTDPLSLIPALGPEASARLACHLVASDSWTTGIPPAYAAVTLNLPPGLGDDTLGAYLAAMGAEWARLGIAVVSGHTGRYEGCDLTIVGAATVIGVGDEGRTVGPAFVKPGDHVIVTKGCAIEATAIAAHLFPQRLLPALEEDGVARARALLGQVSVVEECTALLRMGVRDRGVSCLHDATEGGVLGGLVELARASGKDLRVEASRIPLAAEARAACAEFGIDPYWTLSEGTLLATVRPEFSAAALAELTGVGIPAAVVGDVARGTGRVWLTRGDQVTAIDRAQPDPYWAAYARAVREGWT